MASENSNEKGLPLRSCAIQTLSRPAWEGFSLAVAFSRPLRWPGARPWTQSNRSGRRALPTLPLVAPAAPRVADGGAISGGAFFYRRVPTLEPQDEPKTCGDDLSRMVSLATDPIRFAIGCVFRMCISDVYFGFGNAVQKVLVSPNASCRHASNCSGLRPPLA